MEKHIILLHGALGSKTHFENLRKELNGNVHAFNFYAHGGETIPEKLKMSDLVDQLNIFISQHIPAERELVIFGYSMGGYAALLLASKNVCKIDRIITLGTKLFWNEEIAAKELKMLDPDLILEKLPDFAKDLKTRHEPADWKLLLRCTGELMTDLGSGKYMNDDTYSQITVPCKLMIGDKDRMVTLDETVNAFQKIKGASLSVLPSTPHPIEKVSIARLAFEING